MKKKQVFLNFYLTMKRSVIFTKKYRILTLKCLIPSNPMCCDKSSPFISKSSCVFHKNTTFHIKKDPPVFSQNTSFYIKHLNLSKYKTCLYNLFYLFTQKYQRPSCVFSQNTTFHIKKSSCVLTKTLKSE